ncbi:MAG: hypothetical protein PHY47_15230 [Lachnospiraceae bacterium]|nr:hypothetical protein [Lachnospiraceae bacterium]
MMTDLLVMKERLKIFYGKYEIYITPFLKFVLALISLFAINQNIGYMYRLKNPAIVLVVALLCSFLPINIIIIFGALFVILHLYTLSMECAIVVLVLFLLMFLLYFRFSPKDTLAVLLTPVCFALHIPYVVPLAAGFMGTPLSTISVSGGVIVYYVLNYIKLNSSTLGNLEADSVVQKFKYVVDGIINNKAMLVTVIAFSITVVVVYLIRRLSVDYSWRIATIAGVITNVIIILFGDFFMDLNVSIIGTILGNLISILLIMILQFFVFSVDYSRTEFVQFEDDEYYYYVKAIPKMMIATPEKKIKRINPQKQTQLKNSDKVLNPDRVIKKRGLDEDFDIR